MNDDAVTKFMSKAKVLPQADSPQPMLPASLVPASADGRAPYEAFGNEVRAQSVEIRCYRTGLSYSIDYAHLGARVFEFLTSEKLSFSGGGFGVVIKGRNLRDLLLAINLHTCGFIQDFHPEHFIMPEPVDPAAAFVESIDIVVLRTVPTGAKK